ncbi:MAG: membrane protein [Clostridia bacterium]|nr:membrane protein [Clostridia bacterium]
MAKILKQMNPIKLISQKDGAKRMAIMFMSILLMGFAVSVFSYSGMGVDPFTALNMSISAKLGISFGFLQMCVNGVVLVLVALTADRLINVGTIVNMVGVGYVCEFFTSIYNQFLPQENPFAVRLVLMALGVFLLSLSASLYFNCNVGVSPYDALGFVMEEKTKLKYRWCRVVTDLICTGVAFLLGGPIGIGTVVTAFFMGPVISFCDNSISKKVLQAKYNFIRHFTVIRYYDLSYIQGNRVA